MRHQIVQSRHGFAGPLIWGWPAYLAKDFFRDPYFPVQVFEGLFGGEVQCGFARTVAVHL